MDDSAKLKSLKKSLDLLSCFSVKQSELGITELSQQLGLYKSTVHNIVSTFELCGFLEKNPVTNKYRLGTKILELAHVVNANLGLHQIVEPHIRRLANEINETVYFAIPKEGQVLYIGDAYPSSSYAVRSIMGETAEMYCTALGKAMLAFLPAQAQTDAIEKQSMIVFTPNTITSAEHLRSELVQIRNRGYSVDNMEHEFGVKCVAVPVYKRDNSLLGAISVSGPSLRFDENAVQSYASTLLSCGREISLRI